MLSRWNPPGVNPSVGLHLLPGGFPSLDVHNVIIEIFLKNGYPNLPMIDIAFKKRPLAFASLPMSFSI